MVLDEAASSRSEDDTRYPEQQERRDIQPVRGTGVKIVEPRLRGSLVHHACRDGARRVRDDKLSSALIAGEYTLWDDREISQPRLAEQSRQSASDPPVWYHASTVESRERLARGEICRIDNQGVPIRLQCHHLAPGARDPGHLGHRATGLSDML